MSQTTSLYATFRAVQDDAKGATIEFKEIVKALNHRGFGPLILAPALFVVLPTGAIPTVPSMCAIIICMVAVQMIFGRTYPWIPKQLEERSVDRKKFENGFEKAKPWIRRIDKLTSERLAFLTITPVQKIIALCCIGVALTMIPLELVPFAAFLPAFVIFILALGLSAKDGLITLMGLVLTAAYFAVLPLLLEKMESPF